MPPKKVAPKKTAVMAIPCMPCIERLQRLANKCAPCYSIERVLRLYKDLES